MVPTACAKQNQRWFAVETYHNYEQDVARQLQSLGFLHFLPCYRATVRHARKVTSKKRAFFPRYLFVAFDVGQDRWFPIKRMIGVKSLVMQGEKPLPAPYGVIEQLQAMTDELGYVRLGTELDVGDDVRVMEGTFAEMMGRIQQFDGQHRVKILIEMMNGHIPVTLERDRVVKVKKI